MRSFRDLPSRCSVYQLTTDLLTPVEFGMLHDCIPGYEPKKQFDGSFDILPNMPWVFLD